MKTLGIHQPNYLPWIGYFYKWIQCDEFVILDDVAFSKGSYTNRVLLPSKIGHHNWLTVPVKKHTLGTPINEIIIDRNQDWETLHYNKIIQELSDLPYFTETIEFLKQNYEKFSSFTYLSEYNTAWLTSIKELLAIDTKTILSSNLRLAENELQIVLNISKSRNADQYLSGIGGKKYLDLNSFKNHGISVSYSLIQDIIPFLKNKKVYTSSIIASLAAVGVDSLKECFNKALALK